MMPEIEAIFLDLGNTLRILLKDEAHQARARRKMARLAGVAKIPTSSARRSTVATRPTASGPPTKWVEAPEAELWTRWLLPDCPREQIESLATELTFQYRQSMGRRVVQEDGRRWSKSCTAAATSWASSAT